MNSDRLNDLVNKLYASLLDQDGFQSFIASLINACLFRSATIVIVNQSTGTVRAIWAQGLDIKWQQVYEDKYKDQDPLLEMIKASPVGKFVYITEEFVQQETFIKSDFNQKWLRPQNMAYIGGITLLQEGDWITQLFVQRTQFDGPFNEQDIELINRLTPHLQRAAQIFQRLYESGKNSLLTDSLFDSVQIPVLLLDVFGNVCHQNRKAEIFFRQQDLLKQINRRLSFIDSLNTSHLESAIYSSITHKNNSLQSVEIFHLNDGLDCSTSLIITPLYNQQSDWAVGAAVYIFDTRERFNISRRALNSLFQLTDGESRVCQALVAGKSPAEIALSLNYSIETVRSYLKQVMKKTSTSRQNDLVAMILSSPAFFTQQESWRCHNMTNKHV